MQGELRSPLFYIRKNNFVSFAAILSLALNSYAVRYVSVAYHKGENEKAGSYYSTVMIGNVVFSVGVIALGAVFSCYADKALNVPEDLRRDVKILFILTASSHMDFILKCFIEKGIWTKYFFNMMNKIIRGWFMN